MPFTTSYSEKLTENFTKHCLLVACLLCINCCEVGLVFAAKATLDLCAPHYLIYDYIYYRYTNTHINNSLLKK